MRSQINDQPRWLATVLALVVVLVSGVLASQIFVDAPFIVGFGTSAAVVVLISGRWSHSQRTPKNLLAAAMLTMDKLLKREAVYAPFILALLAQAAMTHSPSLYAFLLFDVAIQNEILRNVLRAVTKPAKQLLLTSVLISIFMFAFSMVALFHYPAKFAAFDLGNDSQSFFWTVVYDMMLPGVAISIDNADDFRDETQSRAEYMENYCFICSLPSTQFHHMEKGHPMTFEDHIEEHHIWNYCHFIFYLTQKDPTLHTGLEQQCFEMIDAGDTSWMPYARAMCLESKDDRAAAS